MATGQEILSKARKSYIEKKAKNRIPYELQSLGCTIYISPVVNFKTQSMIMRCVKLENDPKADIHEYCDAIMDVIIIMSTDESGKQLFNSLNKDELLEMTEANEIISLFGKIGEAMTEYRKHNSEPEDAKKT